MTCSSSNEKERSFRETPDALNKLINLCLEYHNAQIKLQSSQHMTDLRSLNKDQEKEDKGFLCRKTRENTRLIGNCSPQSLRMLHFTPLPNTQRFKNKPLTVMNTSLPFASSPIPSVRLQWTGRQGLLLF